MEKSVLDVVSAVAGWIVALANITLFVIGFLTLRNNQRRISKMENDDKKKYAENVYAWIERRMRNEVEVFCRNGNNSAIYDVQVVLVDEVGNDLSDIYKIELMKPEEERNCNITYIGEDSKCNVVTMFRDSLGTVWKREQNGKLLEIDNVENIELNSTTTPNNETINYGETKRRTVVKSIIWRIIGVLWTFIGAYLIILLVPNKYASAFLLATLIAAYHHSTRMVMYYFYERIWIKIKWGYSYTNPKPLSKKGKILWIIAIVLIVALLLYFLIFINPKIEPK